MKERKAQARAAALCTLILAVALLRLPITGAILSRPNPKPAPAKAGDEYGIPDTATNGNDIATKGRFRYSAPRSKCRGHFEKQAQAWLPELGLRGLPYAPGIRVLLAITTKLRPERLPLQAAEGPASTRQR
ncbi:hypothetical protein EH31_14300 [Erythrobacter longus]|uniref:Uncharacterized protein n=1 Tax=Erythrobacter longus TaxID=1044 RepID=A0A074M8W8_ERYLO|nr:hypothetical protein [Erythrobacter longus]KEO89200.1 hypothetical protein EH31_14300 [Erythrobacter longus]